MEKMNHREYIHLCRNWPESLELDEYETQTYPHPYIEIWMLCQKYRAPGGPPLLPEPDKGVLDQDADLMLGFEVLEELAQEREKEQELRERNKKLAREMNFRL